MSDRSSTAVPATTYLLTICVGVIGCNSLVLGPIAPQLAQDLGVSVPTVVAASSGFGLGTALSALLFARHIDRLGARRVLQIALALFAAALAVSAVAPGIVLLILAQSAAGVAAGVALPAIYSSAAAIAPPGRESKVIGIVLTGWTLSMVAGVSLSAVLADIVHWRAVFAAVAALALVALASLSLSKLDEARAENVAPSPLAALSIPGIVPLLIVCGAFMTAFYGVYGYLGDHIHRGLGQSLSANGLVALSYGAGFGGAAFLDGLVDRLGARRVMPFAYLAVACVYLAMGLLGGSFAILVILVGLWGLTNHFGLNVLVMRLTALDPERRGTIMGLNSAVTYFAVFLGSTGFGPIYEGFGFSAASFTGCALTLVAVVMAMLLLRPAAATESREATPVRG